ncbi:MAG: lysylphosphatidylglycerol synthase domain-containing protein, partial [Myxococcota bacterium]|nr:lysylphosphatidylglycerol synthase domain-containing protein [Myxococcota bacterium]
MGKLLKRTVIGLLIGLGFIWLSAREWPLDSLIGALSISEGMLSCHGGEADRLLWSMELFWLWPYLGILSLIHVLRVVRWKPLLDPIINLDWTTHNRIGAVGFMAMFLLPVRLGELVRPYLVKKRAAGQVRMTEVLS